jgi:hypothetical protein
MPALQPIFVMFAAANPSCGGSTVIASPARTGGISDYFTVAPGSQSIRSSAWRERFAQGRQSRRARQTRRRADFQREADDPHDVFRITLTRDRSPFHVQPVDAVIVVDDTEIDR